MLNAAGDKSFVDDLAASGYCKCESSLCCYEALRFIPCFYDLFFFVFKFLPILGFGLFSRPYFRVSELGFRFLNA